jgi:hypothetical protein
MSNPSTLPASLLLFGTAASELLRGPQNGRFQFQSLKLPFSDEFLARAGRTVVKRKGGIVILHDPRVAVNKQRLADRFNVKQHHLSFLPHCQAHPGCGITLHAPHDVLIIEEHHDSFEGSIVGTEIHPTAWFSELVQAA